MSGEVDPKYLQVNSLPYMTEVDISEVSNLTHMELVLVRTHNFNGCRIEMKYDVDTKVGYYLIYSDPTVAGTPDQLKMLLEGIVSGIKQYGPDVP